MSARKHVGWIPCSGGQIGCPAGILYREREENQSIFQGTSGSRQISRRAWLGSGKR